MNSNFPYSEGTAVITGAASGIGLELAKIAASKKMNLVLADIDIETLHRNIALIELPPSKIKAVQIDVSSENDIEKLADITFATYGSVHILFNNAGVGMNRTSWEHSHADWEWVMGVNLFSVAHAIRHFVPKMLKQDHPSHIVNTASAAGLLSTSGMSAYNASKHGVVTLSETLFYELAELNSQIGVSVLCPAWVATKIHESQRNRLERFGKHRAPIERISQKYEERMTKAVLSGKMSAQEIAIEVFKAVAEKSFYIIPHQKINNAIEARMNDIIHLRNPSLIS